MIWKSIALAAALGMLAPEPAVKCGRLFVFIEGRIEGSVEGNETIKVKTEPDAGVTQKPIEVGKDGVFKTKILFDTANSLRQGDCSRKPRLVELFVFREGQLLKSVTLDSQRDFTTEGWAPDYRLRRPVVLRLEDGKTTE